MATNTLSQHRQRNWAAIRHPSNHTATITVTGAQNLDISGDALNIANLHKFDGTAAAGGFEVWFTGHGVVKATGDAGWTANDTFNFLTPDGLATFHGASVDGGGGADNILNIQADTGAILVAGDAGNITHIHTVENTTTAGGLRPGLSQLIWRGWARPRRLIWLDQTMKASKLASLTSRPHRRWSTGPLRRTPQTPPF